MDMADLLQKAYVYVDDGDFQAAIDIFESLVNTDPMNIEAWEAYMQMCETCEELDYLCERVLQVVEISRADRESILDYYCFLREKMRYCQITDESQKMVTLELVDQFNYTLRDRSLISKNGTINVNLEHRLAWFLRKAILVPYIGLVALGFSLLSRGNNFGYWILMVLVISAFIGMWNIIFPVKKTNQRERLRQAESQGMQDDEIQYHPELIR